jgi:hypothetical protein
MRAHQACRRVLAAVLLLTLAASEARAQRGQGAGLTGSITDETGGVLAGVTLTITSPQLIGGPRTTESDAVGIYRFSVLPQGSYALTATHLGFEQVTHRNIELPVGLALTVDIRLRLSPLESRVDLEGVIPTIDVQSSSSPARIDRAIVENLPAPLSQSIVDVAELAPGVTSGVAFGGPSFIMPVSTDGTVTTDPAIGFPAAGPRLNWAESIQVVSVAAPAEYGEYTSARINVVTRSGGNRYSGLGEYWTTGPRWTDSNRGSLPPGMFQPLEILEWRNVAGQVGGPVIRNRLWFFAGWDYYQFAYRPPSFSGPRSPDEPAASTRESRVLGKLSAAPTDTMRLDGFVEHDGGRSFNDNVGLDVPPEAISSTRYPRRVYNLRYIWSASDRTIVEARYGGSTLDRENGPESEEARNGPAPHFDQATRLNSVNVQSFGETRIRFSEVQFSLTRYVEGFGAKSHELKVGLEHERTRRMQSQRYPGDTLYLDRDGLPELVWFWPGAITRPSFHRTSAFVQDTWRLSERVTLEPGLRVGFYRSSLPDTTAALYENQSVSPRIGAAWDASADHRTVVRAHYGHYHEGMYTALFDFLDPLANAPTITARVTGPGQFEEISRSAVTLDDTTFDPDAGHMYAEEYFAGVEREIRPRLSVKAQYIRRNTRNTLGYVDTGSTWTPLEAVDPGPDGRTGTADDGALMTLYSNDDSTAPRYVLTNPEGAWRRYDAVQVVANRRYGSGWSLETSYTWARTLGNYDNDAASNAGSSDLSSNGNFANPNRAILSTGRTVYDRRHDLKIYGTYALPFWDIRISGVYRFTSGAPYARIVTSFPPETRTSQIYAEPVGAYELPALNRTDLRVEKTFNLPRSARFGLYLDVFNVNNQDGPTRVNNFSGSAFGQPRSWRAPRQFRGGVRATF